MNIYSNRNEFSSIGIFVGDIGVTFSVLLRRDVEYMDLHIDWIWFLMSFLLEIIAIIVLRITKSRKLKHVAFDKNSEKRWY